MYIPGLERVTARSSDGDIFNAINLAGAYLSIRRPHQRRRAGDIPKEFSPDNNYQKRPKRKNPYSWVKPADIGPTSSHGTALLDRLKQLVESGDLEMRYHTNMPRFRVRRPNMLD